MTPQKSITPRAWAELFLLAAIWGGSFISNRIALNEVPVLTTVTFRVVGAALLLWAYVAARGLPLPRAPRIGVSQATVRRHASRTMRALAAAAPRRFNDAE